MSNPLSTVEKRILGESYSSSEAWDNLQILCDDFGGRFAGTAKNKGAADFLLSKFEDYGFKDPHLESFNFQACETGSSRLEIIKPSKKAISCLTLPMTASGEVDGEVVFVDVEQSIDEKELAGMIVVSPVRLQTIREEDTLVKGFIWMHPYPAMGPPTGCVHSTIPSVSVKYEDGMILKRMLRRHGSIRVNLEAECEIFKRESWNVCGEIPGNGESEDFILLGGHYDGHEIAQAAFDCGAPCTAVIEMGRILMEENRHLKGNVRVVCFSAEEFGCWGSKDYVKRRERQLKNLRFTYQLDCCGGGGTQMVTTDYWPKLEYFYGKLASDLNMIIPYEQRRGPGDSRAFFEQGIPTGSIIDYRLPGMMELLKTYRHTEYDTLDKINIKSLREAVAIGALSGLRIVNAEEWPSHRTPSEIEEARRELQF